MGDAGAANGSLQTQTDAWLTFVADFQAEMDAHIRFEEKALFETAQRLLDADTLESLVGEKEMTKAP